MGMASYFGWVRALKYPGHDQHYQEHEEDDHWVFWFGCSYQVGFSNARLGIWVLCLSLVFPDF